jgi:hypothetical protein
VIDSAPQQPLQSLERAQIDTVVVAVEGLDTQSMISPVAGDGVPDRREGRQGRQGFRVVFRD